MYFLSLTPFPPKFAYEECIIWKHAILLFAFYSYPDCNSSLQIATKKKLHGILTLILLKSSPLTFHLYYRSTFFSFWNCLFIRNHFISTYFSWVSSFFQTNHFVSQSLLARGHHNVTTLHLAHSSSIYVNSTSWFSSSRHSTSMATHDFLRFWLHRHKIYIISSTSNSGRQIIWRWW